MQNRPGHGIPGRPVSIVDRAWEGREEGRGADPSQNSLNPISPLDTEDQRTVRGAPTPLYEQPIELPQLVHL